jgi:hypothetical protein
MAACSNAGTEADHRTPISSGPLEPAVLESEAVPEEQRQYLADDKVTLSEYQSAYSAFAQCAVDAGVGDDLREQGRDVVTGLITYSTRTLLSPPGQTPPGQSDGSQLNECFHRWFAHVERAFQATDAAVLAAEPQEQMEFFNENIRPCLEQLGVNVPEDLEFNDENWGQLNDEAVRAFQDGRCSSNGGTGS